MNKENTLGDEVILTLFLTLFFGGVFIILTNICFNVSSILKFTSSFLGIFMLFLSGYFMSLLIEKEEED